MSGYGNSGYGNSSHGSNSSYGSNRYGNDSTSTGYGNHANAYKDGLQGKNAYSPGKDPHQHWKDADMGRESKGGLSSIIMHWPIQLLEQQLQYISSSKADAASATNSIMTDFVFRWLGVKNMSTVLISFSSFITGILVFIFFSMMTRNIIFSYVVLIVFLSHSFFPGYIIYRMKKFVVGEEKTGKYASIIRTSWYVFEGSYLFTMGAIFYFKDRLDWIEIKANLLVSISEGIFKRILYKPVLNTPLELMPQILSHMLNAMLIAFILYLLMIFITNKKARVERSSLTDELDKEHLRPAEIVRKKAKRGITRD